MIHKNKNKPDDPDGERSFAPARRGKWPVKTGLLENELKGMSLVIRPAGWVKPLGKGTHSGRKMAVREEIREKCIERQGPWVLGFKSGDLLFFFF